MNIEYLGLIYTRDKRLSEMFSAFEKSNALCMDLQDTTGIAETFYYLGYSCYYMAEYKKAIEYYKNALNWHKTQNNISRVDIMLYELAYCYLELDDFEKALEYADRCYELEKKNSLDISYGQDAFSAVYEQMGDYPKAKKYYQLSLNNLQDEPTSHNYGIGLSSLGNIHTLMGEYDSAMIYFLEFLEVATHNKDEYSKAAAYYQIAKIQLELSELKDAKKNILLAIEYYQKTNIKMEYLEALEVLSKILIQQKDYKEAKKIVDKGLNISKTADSKSYAIGFYLASGTLKRATNQPRLALAEYTKALKYAQEMNNPIKISIAYYEMALTEKILANYNRAFEFATNSLNHILKSNNKEKLNSTYKLLAELAALTEQYNIAYEYQLRYQGIQDSMLSDEREKYLMKYYTEFQVNETTAENKFLKDKQAQSQVVIQQRTLIGIFLGTGLLIFFAIAAWLFQNNRQKQFYNKKLERKVRERTEALETANENLQQANYELRTFNYIASHDIKEPIRNIGNYVGLIRRKLPDDLKGTLGFYFDTIKHSTKQLYTLIEDFSYYSSLSKGETVKTEPIDLNVLTQNVVEQLKESITKYNGNVHINNLPTISTNNAFLFVALKNLIENGLKYNKSEKPTVTVYHNQTTTHHQIIIKDNGIGIEKQYHERIFEMFKRLHNREVYEGSGIGLAIVKLVIHKLNGTIQVDSQVGEGSRFTIALPL